MDIEIGMEWLMGTVLVAIRVAGVLMLTPVLAITRAPTRVRIMFVLVLAAMLVTSAQVPAVRPPATLGQLAEMSAHELVVGALLAFGVFAAFGAFLLGGRILDYQMGFGIASLIDPATNTQTAMIGVVLNMTAVMFFFSIDGHHMLIRGLAYSLQQLPPGTSVLEMSLGRIVAQFGSMFVFAVTVVAPALFSVLLLDACLAVAARTMPQVNIFFVSFPLKIFVGLTVLAVSMRFMAPVMEKILGSIFVYWQDAFS